MKEFQQVTNWRDRDALLAVPAASGILRIELASGPPYIGKTADLRRRMRRLLHPPTGVSSRLSLTEIATHVYYSRTGSRFESDLMLYRTVSTFRPGDCRNYLKLRPPSFVKVLLRNRFPRTCLTRRLTRSRALFFGPFPTRHAAEQFHGAFLDLFQVRRCTENLDPSPNHPGCIWGEMDLCLRPCQRACDDNRYAAEVEKLVRFLRTDGNSLLDETEAERNRASAAMEFETAAQQHRILSKAKDALRLRGGLSRELGELNGMVLQASVEPFCVELTPLYKGSLQTSIQLPWGAPEPTTKAFAAGLREILAAAAWSEATLAEREDHLALLQRWHESSFRRGEFVPFPDAAGPPIRRLANAAMRVATDAA